MQALYAQLLVGLINGSFYALLSLGLAVIFGMLNIINFAHGALYMMGAFVAYFLLSLGGISYWWALLIAPVIVGIFGIVGIVSIVVGFFFCEDLSQLLDSFVQLDQSSLRSGHVGVFLLSNDPLNFSSSHEDRSFVDIFYSSRQQKK